MNRPHLVLYDGECGLCHGLVRFVLPRDPAAAFHFAALQGPAAERHLARFGGRTPELTTVFVVANYRQPDPLCLVKARAVLFVFRSLGWPWRFVAVLGLLPTSWLDRGYDFIARHRHRLFGRRDACLIPAPEHRERFLEG